MPLSQVPRAPRVWVPTLRRALSPESTRGFQGALSPCTPAPAGHYRDAANREPGGHSSGCTVMQKRCPLGVRGGGLASAPFARAPCAQRCIRSPPSPRLPGSATPSRRSRARRPDRRSPRADAVGSRQLPVPSEGPWVGEFLCVRSRKVKPAEVSAPPLSPESAPGDTH